MDSREEERKKKMAEYNAALEAKRADLRLMMAEVTKTEAGKKLLRYLHDICGFAEADRVIGADGRIDTMATIINSERRNVYVNVRSLVPVAVLREIEHTEEK